MAKGKEQKQKQKQKQSDDDEDHDYSGKCVAFLNLFSMLAGIAMVAVGGMLLLRAIKGEVRMNVDKWISTIYSVLMGILVIASSVRIKFILREFRFMSKLFGRGLLYIFVGIYYLNVVSGGVEVAFDTLKEDPLSLDGALPFLVGSLVTCAGLLFIFFHICWCYEGCLGDGSRTISPNIEDMQKTALKTRYKWLDFVVRIVIVAAGAFLCFVSYDIFSMHFGGCNSIDELKSTCHETLDRYSVIYLFEAVYAGCFGIVVVFAGLEWEMFIGWFGFLSRPMGKAVYFFFVAVYFMGSGRTRITWPWEDSFDLKQNLPPFAGMVLLGLGVCLMSCFLCPCMGRCCSDRTEAYHQKKKRGGDASDHRTNNPSHHGDEV